MSEITLRKPLLIQHGIAGAAPTSNWTDYETDISAQSGTQSFLVTPAGYSQIYDYELVFDSERGLSLDKPVFFSNSGNFLRFQVPTNQFTRPSIFTVSYYHTLDQQLWETGATANEVSSEALLLLSLTNTSPEWVFNAGTNRFDLDFSLDMNLVFGERPGRSVMLNVSNGRWQGRLALSFTVNVTAFQFLVQPTTYVRGFLTQPEVPAFTGRSGFDAFRGRPVRDMRSGLPAFAEDLSEDQFVPGIWTEGPNVDQKDPRDVQPVQFPPNESTKDDPVPV